MKIKLSENKLHKILNSSIDKVLSEGYDAIYNKRMKDDTIVKETFGITRHDVQNVFNALYGGYNYNSNTYGNTFDKWWNIIMANARKTNRGYNKRPNFVKRTPRAKDGTRNGLGNERYDVWSDGADEDL